MPYKDLREFLKLLEEKGDLIRVKRKIDLEFEVGKALRKLYHCGGKSVIFEQPGDCQMPLCAGIYSTREKTLWAFEATEDNIFEKVLDGLQNPIPPTIREIGECHEVVLQESEIDLSKIPVATFAPADGGPYFTAGITVSKDPETGVPDIGHYRFQVIGKNKMSFYAQPFHRFGKNIIKAKRHWFLGYTRVLCAAAMKMTIAVRTIGIFHHTVFAPTTANTVIWQVRPA